MCFKGVLFCFNLTTKVAGAMLGVAGGNPRPPALSDNPDPTCFFKCTADFFRIFYRFEGLRVGGAYTLEGAGNFTVLRSQPFSSGL